MTRKKRSAREIAEAVFRKYAYKMKTMSTPEIIEKGILADRRERKKRKK